MTQEEVDLLCGHIDRLIKDINEIAAQLYIITLRLRHIKLEAFTLP